VVRSNPVTIKVVQPTAIGRALMEPKLLAAAAAGAVILGAVAKKLKRKL